MESTILFIAEHIDLLSIALLDLVLTACLLFESGPSRRTKVRCAALLWTVTGLLSALTTVFLNAMPWIAAGFLYRVLIPLTAMAIYLFPFMPDNVPSGETLPADPDEFPPPVLDEHRRTFSLRIDRTGIIFLLYLVILLISWAVETVIHG